MKNSMSRQAQIDEFEMLMNMWLLAKGACDWTMAKEYWLAMKSNLREEIQL